MAKKRKLPKKYEEEEEYKDEKLSVNRLKGKENDGPVSVNRALEEEQFERGITTSKGIVVPKAEEGRDPKMDEEPIEEEDLGLPEDSFLLDRKVGKLELLIHMNAQEKQFLGSNIRKPRDFASIFENGMSSPEDPKLDMAYEVDQNPEFKKELIAQQLLRNFHSDDSTESRNAQLIFKELDLWDDEDEIATDFKEELKGDPKAHLNLDLVQVLQERIPNL
jgi:hypothetical protein